MEPEKTPLEKENHLPNHRFQVRFVNLPGCIYPPLIPTKITGRGGFHKIEPLSSLTSWLKISSSIDVFWCSDFRCYWCLDILKLITFHEASSSPRKKQSQKDPFFKEMTQIIWCFFLICKNHETESGLVQPLTSQDSDFSQDIPETNSSHLKMDGWNTSFFPDGLFSGAMLVSGSVQYPNIR